MEIKFPWKKKSLNASSVVISQEIMSVLPLVLGIAPNVGEEPFLSKQEHQPRNSLPKDLNHEEPVEIRFLVKFIVNSLNKLVMIMD